MFENRVLRRIFGPKRDEATGGWRKLCNEPRDLYSSPSRIGIIKSRGIRWTTYVARKIGMRMGLRREIWKGRDRWEDQDVDGWIIL
jgi:hypothetical protein